MAFDLGRLGRASKTRPISLESRENEGTLGKLAAYTKKHERPFTLEYDNGKGTFGIMFYDGYVTLQGRQPRTTVQEIHIPKSVWYDLLWYQMREIKQVSKLMEGPDFDRHRAERRYYAAEAKHLVELREMKRSRHPRRRRRSRRT